MYKVGKLLSTTECIWLCHAAILVAAIEVSYNYPDMYKNLSAGGDGR